MSEPIEGWAAIDAASRGGQVGATPTAAVVGLGAICDLRPPADSQPHSQSFSVGEFATLSTGDRLMLHHERGFTLSTPAHAENTLPGTVLVEQALNVVLPDKDTGEDHPWYWLAELARTRGLEVTADQLRQLPYEVLVTDRLLRWLEGS